MKFNCSDLTKKTGFDMQVSKGYWAPLGNGSVDEPARLHLNENHFAPRGFDPYYGESPRGSVLNREVAKLCELSPSRVVVGPGSSTVLSILLLALASRYEKVCIPSIGWGFYQYLAELDASKKLLYPMLQNHTPDFSALRKMARERGSLVLLNTPHMPSGVAFPIELAISLARDQPGSFVIVDEAYLGFSRNATFALPADLPGNIAFVRTFSKFFGMARQRLGFLVGSEQIVEEVGPAICTLGVNQHAEAAGLMCLRRLGEITQRAAELASTRDAFRRHVRELGIECPPSMANFLLLSLASDAQCAEVLARCALSRIQIRDLRSYGYKASLRVTVGRPPIMQRLLDILRECLEKQMPSLDSSRGGAAHGYQ